MQLHLFYLGHIKFMTAFTSCPSLESLVLLAQNKGACIDIQLKFP